MEENKKNNLSVSDLGIGYGRVILFEHLDFSGREGEVIAILGANGTGKSTLLRTLCRLQKKISGDIFIGDRSFSTYSHQSLALQISNVFTGSGGGVPHLNVYEILKLGRFPYTNFMNELRPEDKEIIDATIELLELNKLLDKPLYQISDGELQKVFIGRALIQDTPVMLLDEPGAHLDIFNKASIFRIIARLAREKNKTIFVATHDMELAVKIADRCLLLGKNKQSIYGDTEELIKNGSFQKLFISAHITFNENNRHFDIDLS